MACWTRLVFLAAVLAAAALSACAASQPDLQATVAAQNTTIAALKAAQPSRDPQKPTATSQPAAPATPAPTRVAAPTPKPAPPATVTPGVAATPAPTPTPEKPGFVVTMRDGRTLQFSSLEWQFTFYASYEYDKPSGIPTAAGLEVDWDYIAKAEFGARPDKWDGSWNSAPWPVVITLTDGSVRNEALGWKARLLSTEGAVGTTSIGKMSLKLEDIRAIVLQRKSAPGPLLAKPPSYIFQTVPVTVVGRNGSSTSVFGASLRTRCVSGIRCCFGDKENFLPTVGGLNINLDKIRKAEFGDREKERLPVLVDTVDGRSAEYEVRGSSTCTGHVWRLTGYSALGSFDIELTDVKRLETQPGDASATLSPEPTPRPGPFYTVVTRDGRSIRLYTLRFAGSEYLRLAGGLQVSYSKVKTIVFGEKTGDQVGVTVTGVDGQTVSDTAKSDQRVTGDVALGSVDLAIEEVREVTMQ